MSSNKHRDRLSRALNEIDMEVHAKLGSGEVLQAALDGYVRALGADAGDIKQFDGTVWIVTYVNGFAPETVGTRLTPVNAPVASRAAELRQPVAISDYLAEPPEFQVGFPVTHGLRSALAVPLVIRDEVVGCVFAWMRTRPRTYTDGEIDFARRTAATVALALENARLFESERHARERAEQAEWQSEEEIRRISLLLRATQELSTAPDADDLLERLGRILTEATGISRAFINLLDMRRRVLTTKVATGGLKAPGIGELEFEALSITSQEAIANGRTTLLDYDREEVPPRDKEIARANGAHLVLFVPLVHRGEIVGHISLDEPNERCDFTAERVAIVENIAAQTAVLLVNARLLDREHRIAETLQRAILATPETIDGIRIDHLYRPASPGSDVGGDFYDVFALNETRVAILIGDVSGKGVDAAALTTLIRDGARAYLLDTGAVDGVLQRLNSLVCRFTPSEKFATAFLGVLDCSTGVLEHVGAGHPTPAIVNGSGVRSLQTQPGMLGAFPDMSFPSARTSIAQGDTLVLFTDGVTEARRDGRFFGEEGVLAALDRLRAARTADLSAGLLEEVLGYVGGRLRDDVVILAATRE